MARLVSLYAFAAVAFTSWTSSIVKARHSIAEENFVTAGEPVRHGVGNATWTGVPHIVSWAPMATVYENFLSDEECEYILNISRPVMEPAMLVQSDLGIHKKSKSRTSSGAFFHSYEDPILAMITNRIGHAARIPPGNLEPWQIMKYGPHDKYTSHVDYYERDTRFFGNDVTRFGGQRIMTALLYLTSCEGGETVFKKAPTPNAVGELSCAGKGAGVKAVKGRMLIFHDVQPDGSVDNLTSHQSCPVTEGEKVVVSRFIRQDHCYLNKYFSARKWNGNVFCEDDHTRCEEWAARGHCDGDSVDTKMHLIMHGDDEWPGFCEKTCNVCRPLEDTVIELRGELGQDIPPEARPEPLDSGGSS